MSEMSATGTKTLSEGLLTGALLMAAGVILCSPVIGPEGTAFVSLVLAAIWASPARRERVLAISGVATLYFVWKRNVPESIASDARLISGTLATWSVATVLVVLNRRRIGPFGLLLGFLAIIALLGWSGEPAVPVAREIYFALSRFGFLIWYLGLALAAWKERPYSHRDLPFVLAPFWSLKITTLPMPGPGPLMDRAPLDRATLQVRQLAGIRIILLGWTALAVRDTINWTLFAAGNALPFLKALPTAGLTPFTDGFGAALASHAGIGTRWLCVIAHFVQAYMEMAYFCAFPVGMARLAGLELPPMFDSPWKARTMAQFYGRMLFYYNRMLIGLFYRPLKSRLRFIRSRQLQVYLALVGSLFTGGFLIHFVRDFRKIADRGFLAGVLHYANTIPYFLAITMLVGASVFARKSKGGDGTAWQVARASAYLVGWALVYTAFVATAHSRTTWPEYLAYMRSLIAP